MATWPPITRDDLRHAAGSAGFDMVFPLLVRRLIAETGKGLTELDMPGGSGVATGGFDGVVTATGETAFVPSGTSVWELSVGGGQDKANDDYGKRQTGPNGQALGEVTYVQAILAPWTKSAGWAEQRRGEGRWKDVRAYNLDKIHLWLDAAPATTAWLAEQLGKAMPGVRPAAEWWSGTWLPSTTIELDARVVLAGREQAAESLRETLNAGQEMISLGGDMRPDEARAFVAATLEPLERHNTRALFVTDPNSLAQLIQQPQPLILFLPDRSLAADLPRHQHQILLLAEPGAVGTIPVPRVDGQAVATKMQADGLDHERTWSLGALARRSLLALRRSLAKNPTPLTPSWVSEPDVIRRRLLLIGGWFGAGEHDRTLVARCVGRPYELVHETALKLAAVPEIPFVAEVDDHWHLLSPEDAWTLLGPQLTPDDLHAFRSAALEVFSEVDPNIATREADPFQEMTSDVRRKFSGALRMGLAQTLALLGGDTSLRAPRNTTGAEWARLVVRDVLRAADADDTYALWTSLGDVLPLLAEAAPQEVLAALSRDLPHGPRLHRHMFQDKDRNQFGSGVPSPHLAVLAALSVVAWSTDYVDEVVEILGQLAAIDPGGTWSNRPANSLVSILSCWAPNTTADLDHRIRMTARLLRQQPEVALPVLHDLLPHSHRLQIVQPGPRFRDWKQTQKVTRADVDTQTDAVVEMLLDNLSDEPDRFIRMISHFDQLSPAHRAVFADRLNELGAVLTDDVQRERVFDAVREFVARHREYSDAGWALPEERLLPLEVAAEAVRPHDPVRRNAWLFASDWITLGDHSRRDDIAAYQRTIRQLRSQAIEEICRSGGEEALAELATNTNYPHLVGDGLAGVGGNWDDVMLVWLTEDNGFRPEVAFAYLAERLRDGGTEARDRLLHATTNTSAQARILRATREPRAAWTKLTELDPAVADRYWREFVFYGLGHDFEFVLEAARSLTAVGRPAAALHLLVLYRNRCNTAEAAEIAADALDVLIASGREDPEFATLRDHDFREVIALLADHRDTIGAQRLLTIEWQLFPVLGFEADAPALHGALAEDPALFVELVRYAFKGEGIELDENESEGDEPEPARQDRALRAYEVLHDWRRCPGVRADGTLDADRLRQWVDDARARLGTLGRQRVGDSQIGQILAYAPPDPDGVFPPRPVRDLLEDLRSHPLENGLHVGIYNRRGVTTRGVYDGGDQERQLATDYQRQASAAAAWPRTRKLLTSLAESYERDARGFDVEAERARRGLRG
ncbi:hypothetical protein [Paractinoplanes brasiliensis]|uniref:Uncharacterized protein n=1 Tax=Paractinoplanes brasiliensis TaxID=52695 RepID=A0A4R6JSF7_9ACTN|nr:hypothetical protein [Actinoplanes brasiliensis]TDO39534.1 hypothetical protein C8E87_3225 [Actinoplanes brasiliensis]GID29127.1 hypothetical protein Abr02nite_41100 [Actinoplanes brasiliensis]